MKVFGEALQSLAELFFKERYPDDEERQRFAAKVRGDVENPDYRLYTTSYAIRNMLLIQVIPSSDVNRVFTTIHDGELWECINMDLMYKLCNSRIINTRKPHNNKGQYFLHACVSHYCSFTSP